MPIKPKAHQKDALKKITRGLTKHRRAQVTMACGTGKSYVSAWTVQAAKAQSVLVLVPSLALVRQLKESFESVFSCPTIAVCSDKTVAGQDTVVVSEEELGCQVTTDPAVVKAHLAQPGKRLVFCTYQSAPRLKGFKFDLGIFDEAHKTAGWQHKAFGFALHDKNIRIKQRVFFTATPRVTRTSNDEVASMDDVKVYGPKVYELPFRKAVKRGIICDYRLIISEINEDVDTQHHAALQVAIQKAMDARGIKKVFAFFRTVEQARVFANDTAGFDPSVTLLHVSGAMSTEERKAVIAQFEKADRAVLTNARCLTEGVDVPAVDMVVFAQAKRSTIDIVQAAGRAMRNSPGKERGYIFLPVWRNAAAGETFETAVSREGFRPVLDTLRALASQDALLESALEDMRGRTEPAKGLSRVSDVLAERELNLDMLKRAIAHALVEHQRPRGYWTFERVRELVKGMTRTAAAKQYPGAWVAITRNGWIDRLFGELGRAPPNYWTRERLVAEFKGMTRLQARKANNGAFLAAARLKLIPELFGPSNIIKWTPAKIRAALSGLTLDEARTLKPKAYSAARKRGLLAEICGQAPRKHNIKWTAEAVAGRIQGLPRTTAKDTEPGAYNAAIRLGILDKLCPSRKPGRPIQSWTREEVQALLTGHTRTAVKFAHPGAYKAALRNNWLDEIIPDARYNRKRKT